MKNYENKEVFSTNLRYYIARKGIAKQDLARAAGVSNSSITDWVQGRSYPRMDRIQKLADYLGCEKLDLIEEHSFSNQYYLDKQVDGLAKELKSDHKAVEIFQEIKKLSPSNKEMILNLINSLPKGEDK